MTTLSSHTDQLLDLLYGECTPEEEARLRAEIAGDQDLQRQWEELQATHQSISAQIPEPVTVPEELTARILASAASTSTTSASSRRAPNGTPPPRGLWHSVVSGKLRAPVMLAAILISSSVVIAYLFGTIADDLFMEAQPEVSSVSIGGGGGGGSTSSTRSRAPFQSRDSAPPAAQRAAISDDLVAEEEAEGAWEPTLSPDRPSPEPRLRTRQEQTGAPAETSAPTSQPRPRATESTTGARVAAPSPAPPPSPREPAPSISADSLDSIGVPGTGRGGGAIAQTETLERSARGAAPPAPRLEERAPAPTRARESRSAPAPRRSAPAPRTADSVEFDAFADTLAEDSAPAPQPAAADAAETGSSLLEEAREALATGDSARARRLLQDALAADDLSPEEQTRAEELLRSLDAPEVQPAEE